MTTTILLADDHRIVREGLRQPLDAQDAFEVIAKVNELLG